MVGLTVTITFCSSTHNNRMWMHLIISFSNPSFNVGYIISLIVLSLQFRHAVINVKEEMIFQSYNSNDKEKEDKT